MQLDSSAILSLINVEKIGKRKKEKKKRNLHYDRSEVFPSHMPQVQPVIAQVQKEKSS